MNTLKNFLYVSIGCVVLVIGFWTTNAWIERNKRLKAEAITAGMTAEQKEAEWYRVTAMNNFGNTKQLTRDKVRASLKSPSTAQFTLDAGGSSDNKTIIVTGYVDSQNSFGAMLRSKIYAEWDTRTMTCNKLEVKE